MVRAAWITWNTSSRIGTLEWKAKSSVRTEAVILYSDEPGFNVFVHCMHQGYCTFKRHHKKSANQSWSLPMNLAIGSSAASRLRLYDSISSSVIPDCNSSNVRFLPFELES